MRPGARASSERFDGGRPANCAAQANTAWPVGEASFRARPWPGGADSPGAQRVELIVQAPLQHAARVDELAAVAHSAEHRCDEVGLGRVCPMLCVRSG
jgi:hypothetical protein